MTYDLMSPGLQLPLRSERSGNVLAPPGPGGSGSTQIAASIFIQSVTMTSDHGMLTDNESDWKVGGKKYRRPHWQWVGANYASPVSHSMYDVVTFDVVAYYDAGSGTASLPVRLVGRTEFGESNSESIEFKSESAILQPGRNLIQVKGGRKFGTAVRRLELTIDWKFSGPGVYTKGSPGTGTVYAVPRKTNHEVFVTIFEPIAADLDDVDNETQAITYWRMAYAVETVGALGTIDPHTIIGKLLAGFPGFKLTPDPPPAWQVAAGIRATDCRTIVQYILNVARMVGCPGEADVVLVYPKPKGMDLPKVLHQYRFAKEPTKDDFEVAETPAPKKGETGGLDEPELIHPNGRYKAVLFDHSDGQNAFEACLRFKRGEQTTYYAGGVRPLPNPKAVLAVFKSFSWSRFEGGSTPTEEDDRMVAVEGKKIMPPWP